MGYLEGGFFTGDSERHVREGFGRGHLSLYRGSMRGTWREGSHTEDFKRRHVIEGSGKGAFLFTGAP
jgi:hypothetical protein